jgi:hypothetical protein
MPVKTSLPSQQNVFHPFNHEILDRTSLTLYKPVDTMVNVSASPKSDHLRLSDLA